MLLYTKCVAIKRKERKKNKNKIKTIKNGHTQRFFFEGKTTIQRTHSDLCTEQNKKKW